MKKTLRTLCAFACASGCFAQTQIDLRTQGKDVDFTGASATKPVRTGSALPVSCNVGELFFLTTAAAGQNIYACPSPNNWSPISSPLGGLITSVAGKTGAVILQATDLADCRVSLSSATVLSINSCAFNFPNLPLQTVAASSITLLGGNGTVYIYATAAGSINVRESGSLSIACSGCTDAGTGITFPADVAPIGVWPSTVTPGNWDPADMSDNRTLLNGPPQIAPDIGVAITLNSLGQKLIGIDPAVVETRPAVQAGQEIVCVATGSSSAQTCSLLPTLAAYTTSMQIRLLSSATNVGATTLNIDGLGAKSILKADGATPLAAGDVTAGNYYDLIYDGTVFRLRAGGTVSSSTFGETTLNVLDEFLPTGDTAQCTVGQLGWCRSGAGTFGYKSGYNGHPGTYQILTAATAGDTDVVALNGNSSGSTYGLYLGATAQSGTWEARFTIKTDDEAGSIGLGAYEDGFKDSLVYRSGNSIAVRYDPTAVTCGTGTNSTTTWVLEVFSGGTSSCISTGVTVTDATWYTVDLKSTTAGTVSAQVSKNGSAFSAAVAISSGVPAAQLAPVFLSMSESGVTGQNQIIDWWQFCVTGLTR